MGLETATTVNGLNVNNPLGTDPKSQGDDHIRMIKQVLKDDGFAASVASGSTDKATPVAADLMLIADSAASFTRKKLTWANLLATAKTYFDTLYAKIGAITGSGLTMATGKVLGRSTAGTGAIEELSASTLGLTLLNVANQLAGKAALGEIFGSSSSKSGAYTVVATDLGTVIRCTGTWSLALTAAATLGDKFCFAVLNEGSGTITIDPNASETIDGAATKAIAAGKLCIVYCNGTNFVTVGSIATGEGSGLDADLLDGQHGSYYAASQFDNWVSTWSGAVSSSLKADFLRSNWGVGIYVVDHQLHASKIHFVLPANYGSYTISISLSTGTVSAGADSGVPLHDYGATAGAVVYKLHN